VYLHVGCGELIDAEEIVMICDHEIWADSADNRAMRSMLGVERRVDHAGGGSSSEDTQDSGKLRSVVICIDRMVLSPITSRTLRIRLRRKKSDRNGQQTLV